MILDPALAESLAKQRAVCKAGCSYCCLQVPELYAIEFEAIKEAQQKLLRPVRKLIATQTKKVLEAFDRIAREHPEAISDNDLNAQGIRLMPRIPCPYLVNQKCAVYQVRPTICRCWFNDRRCTQGAPMGQNLTNSRIMAAHEILAGRLPLFPRVTTSSSRTFIYYFRQG